MKIQIKNITDTLVQITTVDERFYMKTVKDKENNDVNIFYPSSSWIASFCPKGIGYYKWLAEHGWDEAEALKRDAGDKGSKVHHTIEDLLRGKEVKMDDKYFSELTNQEEELTVEEWECVMSFAEWFKAVNPITIAIETVIINEKDNYAGTIDYICFIPKDVKVGRMEIKRGFYVIDWKTSQDIWISYEAQISSYSKGLSRSIRKAMGNMLDDEQKKDSEFKKIKLGILQIGYRRNEKKYKFNLIEDKYNIFLAAKEMWKEQSEKTQPRQIDYPRSISLINKEEK
jgi:hypothetical protein